MRSVGRVDTQPEMRLRQALWSRGIRYRIERRVVGTKPDLVVAGAALAVFVDGCFWHGCPSHYVAPVANADRWRDKLYRNQTRDARDTLCLQNAGWTVLRFWECEIRSDLVRVVDEVMRAVRSPYVVRWSKRAIQPILLPPTGP